MMEAAPPHSAGAIADALRGTARDIGVLGRDPAAGDGLIDPLAAIALVQAAAPGDCDGDGRVTIDELVIGVRIALGEAPSTTCEAFDTDGNDTVTISELVSAVAVALE